MLNITRILGLEGNVGIKGAQAQFFFEFCLFIRIYYLDPPFFGILNFIIKIATKI